MYYSFDAISYCFPFDVNKRIYHDDPNCGVLAPYIGKKMAEKEADDFLCEIIQRHPFMPDAMDLEIHMMWHEGNTSGFYQTLRMKNPNDGKENKKYNPSPIRWR